MSKKSNETKSLSEALDILEKAAKDSSTHLIDEVKPELERFKKIISEFAPALQSVKEDVIDSSKEAAESALRASRDAIQKVNQKAKDEPWFLAAIVALIALVIGFALGRQRSE